MKNDDHNQFDGRYRTEPVFSFWKIDLKYAGFN
jgi:hypothetical protein